MSNKVITVNCKKCENYFKINDDGSMTCSWGKGNKPKNLIEKKGKKSIKCTLKR